MITLTPIEVVAFNTKIKYGTIGLRSKVGGNLRLFHIDRELFLDLFPKMSLSNSLKELTAYLPIYAVAELSGIDIVSMRKHSSIQEAETEVANYSSLPTDFDPNDDDFGVIESSPSAKKKLDFHYNEDQEQVLKTNMPAHDQPDQDDLQDNFDHEQHDRDSQIENSCTKGLENMSINTRYY